MHSFVYGNCVHGSALVVLHSQNQVYCVWCVVSHHLQPLTLLADELPMTAVLDNFISISCTGWSIPLGGR